MIVGQNALLNQFVPTFIVKAPVDGQTLVYNSIYKAFVNTSLCGANGGADTLGALLNVADIVDNPLYVDDGQALVYNSMTRLWENQYIDYRSLINAPSLSAPSNQIAFGNMTADGFTSSSRLMFDPLTQIFTVPIGDIHEVRTKIISSTKSITINTAGITRIVIADNGSVAFAGSTGTPGQILTSTGANSTPIWRSGGSGSVTSVSAAGLNGILVSGSPITTSGTLLLSLGDITPSSVNATGTVTGSNIIGSNTGDQTITLTGDVTGTGKTTFPTQLAIVNTDIGTFGSATTVPQITVDSKGRITSVIDVDITGGGSGGGTVTSVNATGGSTGMTFLNGPITTSGSLTLSGLLNVTAGGSGATSLVGYLKGNGANPYTASTTIPGIDVIGNISGNAGGVTGVVAIINGGTGGTTPAIARNNLLPPQGGNAGKVLSTDGTNVSWISSAGVGTVTSISLTGTNGVSIAGSPITSSGTIVVGLGAITPTSIISSGTITSSNISGTNTGNQVITATGDVTGVSNSTAATTLPLTLTSTGVSANTYGSATQVPVFTVDVKGRISAVNNVTITGGGTNAPEIVVFNYSSGSSGNFSAPDALFSKTQGVSLVSIVDTTNCIATYTFVGKANPPKSITIYAQNFATNTFTITGPSVLGSPGPLMSIAGGGSQTAPDIAHGIFTTANVLTLQTPMSSTGASAGLGNRAWLVIIFGF